MTATKEIVHLEGVELDQYLNLVLAADSQEDFDRLALPFLRERFPNAMAKAGRAQVKSAEDIARRRIVRRYDYEPAGLRVSRVGLRWSWYEKELMDRAHLHLRHKPDLESNNPPTAEHTALFLQRTVQEVEAYIKKALNTRHGITGFDL